jgi:hypothetical protein
MKDPELLDRMVRSVNDGNVSSCKNGIRFGWESFELECFENGWGLISALLILFIRYESNDIRHGFQDTQKLSGPELTQKVATTNHTR